MNQPTQPLLSWLPGPALAVAGALGVRWVAPQCTGRAQAIILVTGYLLVPVGLAWFAARLNRRARRRAAAAARGPA